MINRYRCLTVLKTCGKFVENFKRIRMKILAVFGTLLFLMKRGTEGSPERASRNLCTDIWTYCEEFTEYCEDRVMKENCRKTCSACTGGPPVPPGKVLSDCAALKCDHECKTTTLGPVCQCKDGYRLGKDERSCEDIDECKSDNPCEVKDDCVNTEGSYKCERLCGQNEREYYRRPGCCKLATGECGRNSENGGVAADGDNAIVTRWPWMSLITVKSTIDEKCGGILVGKNWVLAAAHCFHAAKPGDVNVLLGIASIDRLSNVKNYSQERRVDKIIIHPGYKYPSHDIALLKLAREVDTTDYVSPTCLPSNEYPVTGENCFATGYASIPRMGDVVRSLQEEKVKITDQRSCASSQKKISFGRGAMCVARQNGTSAEDCQGSTGGPLVCQRCSSCGWYVAGLASKGISCAIDKTFAAFTSVSLHESWIRRTMGLGQLRGRLGAACQIPGKGAKDVIEWSGWEAWGACSASCGKGVSVRRRSCKNGKAGENGCSGESEDAAECEISTCQVVGWGQWGEWSACSSSCKTELRTRSRKCHNTRKSDCAGSSQQTESCGTRHCPEWQKPCKHGNVKNKEWLRMGACPEWTNWSSWSDCSQSCGGGTTSSARKCKSGKRDAVGCIGPTSRTEACNVDECEVCSEWSAWSLCSVSCGAGSQQRSRKCNVVDSDVATNETKPCEMQQCPSRWSEWSDWSECSATCDEGVSTRSRTCLNDHPGNCIGEDSMSKACNTAQCPTWTTWGTWGACDAKCGKGKRKRTRTCQQESCQGPSFEDQDCFAEECPKKEICSDYQDTSFFCQFNAQMCTTQSDQHWRWCGKTCCLELYKLTYTQWSSWSSCSKTCGSGEQTRRRQCEAQHLCNYFNGDLEERRECDSEACAARTLRTCSSSCGGGVRPRPCKEGECDEKKSPVFEPCNTDPCPENLSSWGAWGPCSNTCGKGTRERRRQCNGPEGSCRDDSLTNVEECQVAECKKAWSEWQQWAPCSATCGLGITSRKRTCMAENCIGPDAQDEVCHSVECLYDVTKTCEDDISVQYICPVMASQYCADDKLKHACRKTCGMC